MQESVTSTVFLCVCILSWFWCHAGVSVGKTLCCVLSVPIQIWAHTLVLYEVFVLSELNVIEAPWPWLVLIMCVWHHNVLLTNYNFWKLYTVSHFYLLVYSKVNFKILYILFLAYCGIWYFVYFKVSCLHNGFISVLS